MHLHRFLFPPHGIAELPPYTPRAPQTQPQCLGHPLTFTYPNEKRTADDQHLLLSVHISETSQSDSSLIESSQKQAYHCYPTQYRSLAGALLLNLLQKTPIRRYVTLQLFQTQLFTLICSSGLWLSLSDADEIDSFFHDSEHNSQHKQVTDHQRETLSLMSSFSDLSFCRELKVLSAEKGLSVTREDFHSDFIQQFSRYSVLSVPLVRYVIVLEQLLILFETAERSLGDVNHLLSYFFSSILIQCQASQKMLCVAVLHALRIFLRDENQRRSFLTSNVNGCIYTICTFAHSEEAQFQRIGVETLNIFFLGGDGIQDPDENGAGWILNIIKVDNSLIQHALLLGLINLAKIRPPDKFYLLWSDIFKTLITKEQIEKYTDADRSLVSSLVTLFARSAQTFEVVHNQLNSIISLLSVANRDLQNSVLDILISIARRGESERLSLMNLRAPEWVSAGLRSEPEELVFSSLQFYITYLSSIYSHSTVQAQARNTPYVKWNGVKFSRHCDQIAAQLYCYSFYEFVSLLQPHRSRRIVALSAACLSCFAELGYGASDLLSIQSTSEYIRSGDTYPYIRILLSVFYCDGNPTLSKNESEEFLNKTKLSAISLVSRTISLYSRIDARIAGVVTTIALEQTNILPLPLKFVSLIQIERGANLCNILDMIGRLCRTQNRFRHLCHEGGLLDTLVKIVSRPLDFVQDMKDIHLSIHSPIASSHLTGPPSSNTVVHRIKGDDYASPTSTVSYFAVPSMTWNDAPNSTFNDLFGMKADLERQEFHDPLDSPTIENEDLVDDALLFNHQALDQLGTSMMQTQILQGELDSVPRFLTDSLPTSQWILKSALNTIYCILDRTTLPYLTKNTQTEPIGTTLSRNSPWLLDCLLLNRYSIVQRTARKLLFSVISLSSIQPDPYHIIIPPSTRRMIPLPPPPLIDDGRKGLAIFHFPPTASPRFLPTLPLDRSPATLHSATKFLSVCLREHLDTLTSLASYWESLGSNPQTQLIPSAREHMNSLVDRDRCLRELLEEYLQQSTLITRDDIAYSVLKTENLIQYCCQLFMHPLSSNHLRSALVYLLAIVTDRFEALRTRILTDTLEMIGKVCNVTQLSEAGSPSHQGAFLPCTSTAALYKLYYQLVRTDDSVATPSMYEAAIQRLEKSTQSGATSSFNNFITLKSALVDTYPVQGKVGLNTLLPVFRISVLCQIIALNFSAGMGPFIRSDCSYFDIAYHSRSDQQALMMKYMGGKGFAQTLARPPPRYVYDAISFLLALHIMHNFSKRGFSFVQVREHNLFPLYISLLRLPSPNQTPLEPQFTFQITPEKCFLAASSIAHFCRSSRENAFLCANNSAFFDSILSLLAVPTVKCEASTFLPPSHHIRLVLLFALFTVCSLCPSGIIRLISQYPISFNILSSVLFTRRQHELSVISVKDDPVLSTMPFFRTWTPDPNLLKADSIPCEQYYSALSRIYALRLLSHMHLARTILTSPGIQIQQPTIHSVILDSPHLSFFTEQRTLSRAHVLMSQNPTTSLSSSKQSTELSSEAKRFIRLYQSLRFTNKDSAHQQNAFVFTNSQNNWPREPLNSTSFVPEDQFSQLLQNFPRSPNPIDPELIKHLPSYSPHQLYPVAYSTNSLSADSMKQLSKLEYDQYLQRRSNNYRLFMNCLDKWLVKARQMKQTGNSDILIWNILYRFAFDCQTCETLRGLMDIAQPPPDLGEMINSSKCRDGVELICTIMSTAGAPLEVLIMASTLLAIVAEGKGETQLTQTSPTDSTYTTRTEILRKKVETYSIVKIINLLSSPIPELRLNASRILLALTDHKLGLMAIDDPKAVTTLVSVLDDEPGEILENLIWTIANATQSSNSMRTLFADHHVVSQLIKILKQQVSSSTDHDAITLISPIVCCISNLVEQNSENSREFFKADGIEFFLSLLTTIKSMEETVSFCLISTLVNVSQRLLEANWELGQFDMTNPQVEPTLQQMILSVFVVIQQSDHSHQCETDCVMRSSSFLRLKTHFDTIAVPNHLSLIWDYAKKFPKPPTCVIQTQRTRDSSDIVDEEETNVTEPIIHGEDENEIQKQGLFRPLVGRTRSLDSSYSVRTALLDIIEEFCFHQKFSIVLSDSLKPMSIPTPLASRAFAQEDQANIRSAEFESPFD